METMDLIRLGCISYVFCLSRKKEFGMINNSVFRRAASAQNARSAMLMTKTRRLHQCPKD
jgi:hypothetical protein